MAPPTQKHIRQAYAALNAFSRLKNMEEFKEDGLRVRLEFKIEAGGNVRFADIVVENRIGQTLLVLEITSESTRNIDLVEKRLEYAKKGIRTYVVVDCFGDNGYPWDINGRFGENVLVFELNDGDDVYQLAPKLFTGSSIVLGDNDRLLAKAQVRATYFLNPPTEIDDDIAKSDLDTKQLAETSVRLLKTREQLMEQVSNLKKRIQELEKSCQISRGEWR